jgi:hypothetical protein
MGELRSELDALKKEMQTRVSQARHTGCDSSGHWPLGRVHTLTGSQGWMIQRRGSVGVLFSAIGAQLLYAAPSHLL